jgi:alkanesulfonate monooxygenase SsuD/methylene tetrahydromethanopterin reductase-like flavin-dependent oxidoreductase (luciferase family)
MTPLGVVFLPDLPPERLHAVVRAADDAGVDELWLWEDCFKESGIATAAAALAWSRRIRVGVGILPVPLRNVAVTAMEIATLDRLFPGRARIGMGHGVLDWMGQVGVRAESPMTLLREHVSALRALLAGERVTVDGRYVKLDDVGLDWAPPTPPELLVGAIGERTLKLSGELADGTVLTGGTSPEQVTQKKRLIGNDDNHIVVYLHAATGDDAAVRMAAEGVRWGYDNVDDVSVVGGAEVLAAGARRWIDAGADTVVFQPTPDDPDLEGFIRLIGEQVRPLID